MKIFNNLIITSFAVFTSNAFAQNYGWQLNYSQQMQWIEACENRNDPHACRRLGILEKNIDRQSRQERGEAYENQVRNDIRRREEQQQYTDNYYRNLEHADQARIQGDYSSMYRNYENASQYKQWANDLSKKSDPWYKFWN